MSTTTRKRSAAGRPGAPGTIRILVLRAPGTNCDRETGYAFERLGATVQPTHVNALLAKPRTLDRVHGLVLPGGFSYGDDLGAGTVLGTTIRAKLRDGILKLVARGGIVLGICNGFQVLVKTGLLPGFSGDDPEAERVVALASNVQNRYEDRWVTLRAESDRSVFFRKGDLLHCPIAHAEGRLLTADAGVLRRLQEEDHVALRYVAPDGSRSSAFPHNPNGSTDDVAGLTDATGRILGMMPHPERNQLPWQDPRFHAGTAPEHPEGLRLFENAMAHLRSAR
jgi:phosphoribosylformylglycinamidine synthase